MTGDLRTEQALRTIIPNYPSVLDKRILPSLDRHCLDFIRCSQVAVFCSAGAQNDFTLLSCQDNLSAQANTLCFSARGASTDHAPDAKAASLIFLVAGIGHVLRVNGRARWQHGRLTVAVGQAYFHCARAATRAQLWTPEHSENALAADTLEAFLQRSPYLILKSEDAQGHTDLSPRGGQVFAQADGSLFLPERAGNKVAKSLRNILQTQRASLLLFIPGHAWLCAIDAKARLSAEPALLRSSIEHGVQPTLGLVLRDIHWRLWQEPAIEHSGLWRAPSAAHNAQLTPFPKVLAEHMHGQGLLGKASHYVVKTIVKRDMQNL